MLNLRERLSFIAIAFALASIALLLSPMSAEARNARVLITAFEPFGGEPENASRVMVAALAKDLAEKPLAREISLATAVLPVVYGEAAKRLRAEIVRARPDLVISFGQAYPNKTFRIETTAKNQDEGHADNDGKSHTGKIVAGGPATYASALPVLPIAAALKSAKFAYQKSDDAGGFLCNNIFYNLMHFKALSAKKSGAFETPILVAGFVHVPMITSGTDYDAFAKWGEPALRHVLEQSMKALPPDLR